MGVELFVFGFVSTIANMHVLLLTSQKACFFCIILLGVSLMPSRRYGRFEASVLGHCVKH